MALTDETKQSIITALSNLSESVTESVLKRLDAFGYEATESDAWMIGFAIQKVESYIKNECYISEIPDDLFAIEVDMVCGEFLSSKYQSGQLVIDGLDLDGAVSSIKTGDTSVNFDTNTSSEGKFNSLIYNLMNNGKGELACFRRMQW